MLKAMKLFKTPSSVSAEHESSYMEDIIQKVAKKKNCKP